MALYFNLLASLLSEGRSLSLRYLMIGSIQNTSLDNDPTSNGSGKPTLGAGMCSVVMGPDDWATPRDAIFARVSASLFSS